MKIIFVVAAIALMCYFTSGVSGAVSFGRNQNCTEGVQFINCEKHTCESNGDLTIVSCGVVSCAPGQKEVADPSKNYPDCCPKCV